MYDQNLTITDYIEISRRAIKRAKKVLASRKYATERAKNIYSNAQGKYQTVEKEARQAIAACRKYGLTESKPYVIVEDSLDGRKIIFGILGGDLVPLR